MLSPNPGSVSMVTGTGNVFTGKICPGTTSLGPEGTGQWAGTLDMGMVRTALKF